MFPSRATHRLTNPRQTVFGGRTHPLQTHHRQKSVFLFFLHSAVHLSARLPAPAVHGFIGKEIMDMCFLGSLVYGGMHPYSLLYMSDMLDLQSIYSSDWNHVRQTLFLQADGSLWSLSPTRSVSLLRPRRRSEDRLWEGYILICRLRNDEGAFQ